jgi:hypothetical protein
MFFLKRLKNGEKMRKFFSGVGMAGMVLFLSGCIGEKEAVPQEGVFVVWKTPVMKYADQGFLYHEGEKLRLEIYASGQAVMKLTVSPSQVCSGALCMSKKEFNLRYLSPHYPETLLENLLSGRALFGGEGLERKDHGFTQRIKKPGLYAVEYSVLNGSVVFRDTINDILIKIQKQGS